MVERTVAETDQAEGPGETTGGRSLSAPHRLVLDFSAVPMTDDQFLQFCADNSDLRFETTADKELIVMPPAGAESGRRNFRFSGLFASWIDQDGTGEGFDSSAGFTLPNGARRSPDCAWMLRWRYNEVDPHRKERFPQIVPDFVMELRSPSDRIRLAQDKMTEWIENGARLGWLIDPFEKRVHIYRPGEPVEVLEDPEIVSGEAVLPGFDLNLQEIW